MANFHSFNPFSRRESHSPAALWTYRILAILSWLLLVASSFHYSFHLPADGEEANRHTIWGVNDLYPTPFALNAVIASIYCVVLFVSQIAYVWQLFSSTSDYVNAAAGVASHFILSNLLLFAFVMLFVRSYFYWAELVLIINFSNLSSLYFRHNAHPCFIHIPAVSGPLSWNFVALYWNGAIAVNATSLAARILANVAIWGVLIYGLFFLVVFKDHTIGFALSILTASLGVHQFLLKIIAFQWIFAFTIMAVLFLATLGIVVPGIFGKEISFRREGQDVEPDQERAPLLDDH